MGFVDDLNFDPERIPSVKLAAHIVQIVLSVVVWCMEIAVFRGEGARVVGNNGWTFAVCFLSVPAWIYLIGTPRFPRARRFAEPHAMLVVDCLFFVLWLSAFSTQAAYNTADLCGTVCGVSKAIVAMAVFVTIFFGITTFLSAWTLQYYNFHGTMPGYDKQKIRGGGENIDPDKAAFSMAPHDDEAYAPVQMDDHEPHNDDNRYGSSGYNNGRYGDNTAYGPEDDDPNRYGSLPSRQNAMFDHDTEYNAQQHNQQRQNAPPHNPYAPPSAQDDYDEDRPAQFPTGNYDRAR